jgi:class 3 adenylate cyclase
MCSAYVRNDIFSTLSPDFFPTGAKQEKIRTRVITDQYIAFTDLRGFSMFTEAHPITGVEKSLDRLLDLVGRACLEFGGTNRFNAGDGYCLTFPDASLAMAAVERLAEEWGTFERCEGLHCPLKVVVHLGVLYAFRSYLYGDGLNVAEGIERATSRLLPGNTSIFVTGQVRQDLVGTPWDERLQPVAVRSTDPRLAEIEIYRLL